jgi:hypothetical protein
MSSSRKQYTKLNTLSRNRLLKAKIVVLSSMKMKNFVKFLNNEFLETESKLGMKEKSKRI